MAERTIIKRSIADCFEKFMKQGRVLFFSAPCGFGKTCVADALTEGKSVLRLSAADPDFAVPSKAGSWRILLIDDLQNLQEDEEWLPLRDLIRDCPDCRFLLLSRGGPNGTLMAFQYSGLMTVLESKAFLFEREDVRRLLESWEISASDADISGIYKESIGHPLGVVVTARRMAQGAPFSLELVGECFQEVFRYFETAVYRRFDLPIQRFLLELAPFKSFDLDLARIVTGSHNAGEMLDWLQRNTSMLQYDGVLHFRFWEQFRPFLLWEMGREYPPERKRALMVRGGMYYELKEDYPNALDCYIQGQEHAKVSELLIRNAETFPGMAHYREMEKYYRKLPESDILASPALIQGMSMLCAMSGDYEGSERWYKTLERFAQNCGPQDAVLTQARSCLIWLDISLPQRGVETLAEAFPKISRMVRRKELVLRSFSATSGLPSIVNGGKDFSDWCTKDDQMFKTMSGPLQMVLGKYGVGLAESAVAESKYEKGEDISVRLLDLVQRMGEIRNNGTPEMEFAITALLARSQMTSGRAGDAKRTLLALRQRFEETGQNRYLDNLDALLCRLDLRLGNLDAADTWYLKKAPKDPLHFDALKRYQYLTQAVVELVAGQTKNVFFTLAPMDSYCKACGRHLDKISTDLLRAMALYREQDERWHEYLKTALTEAENYRFVRPASVFGGAILPLLEQTKWTGDAKWFKAVLTDTRVQASFYPDYLRPRMSPAENLTATEMRVLHLICADKSNAEIGEIMDIKLPTVKTHVSRVLEKLGVSRRSEAKTAAKKLWLIPEEL